MHKIAEVIRECTKRCFNNRYEDLIYQRHDWQANIIASGKPLIWGPHEPKVILLSQAPSLQAWLNGIGSTLPDGGLVSHGNNFLINDLLPAFGLSKRYLNLFRDNVFWVHACNCYPWFRQYKTRQDIKPTKGEVQYCLGRWYKSIINLPTVKGLVLMGEVSTFMFPNINPDQLNFTELVRQMKIRTDIVENVETIPIYHQSRKSMVFNNPIDRNTNNRLHNLLAAKFEEWIK
jgi:hypothetical protein